MKEFLQKNYTDIWEGRNHVLWAASYDGLMPSLAACHCYN